MQALSLLYEYSRDNVSRYNHLVSAHNIAKYILDDTIVRDDIKIKILNTVLLHDIGYSNKINETDNHNLDGYRFLKENAPDLCFNNVILLHGDMVNLAKDEYAEIYKEAYDNLTELEQIVMVIVDYCDNHSDGNGNWVNVGERFKEMKERYGDVFETVKYPKDMMDFAYFINKALPYALKRLDYKYGDCSKLMK